MELLTPRTYYGIFGMLIMLQFVHFERNRQQRISEVGMIDLAYIHTRKVSPSILVIVVGSSTLATVGSTLFVQLRKGSVISYVYCCLSTNIIKPDIQEYFSSFLNFSFCFDS